MASLNGIASFVDTIGCRNFNLTHKKVMHILSRNKTIYTHLKKKMLLNIHGNVSVGNFRLQLQT